MHILKFYIASGKSMDWIRYTGKCEEEDELC